MNGMKIAAGWHINFHTLCNLQLLVATLTGFIIHRLEICCNVESIMDHTSWRKNQYVCVRYMVFLLSVGSFGFPGSAITHMAKSKDAW